MVTGAHAIVYSPDAEALRGFLRGELGLYEPRHPVAHAPAGGGPQPDAA